MKNNTFVLFYFRFFLNNLNIFFIFYFNYFLFFYYIMKNERDRNSIIESKNRKNVVEKKYNNKLIGTFILNDNKSKKNGSLDLNLDKNSEKKNENKKEFNNKNNVKSLNFDTLYQIKKKNDNTIKVKLDKLNQNLTTNIKEEKNIDNTKINVQNFQINGINEEKEDNIDEKNDKKKNIINSSISLIEKEEKEKENFENKIIEDNSFNYIKENKDNINSSNLDLENRLNSLLKEIKKEEINMEYQTKKHNLIISKLDDKIISLLNEKNTTFNSILAINKEINNKYNEINKFHIDTIFNNLKKNKSYEEISKIKNKEIENVKKSKNIILKDIKVLEKQIQENLHSHDYPINDETFIINSKNDELNVILIQLKQKIANLEKENKELEKYRIKHMNCSMKIKNLFETFRKTRNELTYLIKYKNTLEINKVQLDSSKKKKREKIKKNLTGKIKMHYLKKSNSTLYLPSYNKKINTTKSSIIKSLYNELLNENKSLSSERNKIISNENNLFKKEEKETLINLIPEEAINKYENKFKKIFDERKLIYDKLNGKEIEFEKVNSLNNFIKENNNKNKKLINSSKFISNQITVTTFEIQNIKRKINEIKNEINKEKKNEIQLIEKNNILNNQIKEIKEVNSKIFPKNKNLNIKKLNIKNRDKKINSNSLTKDLNRNLSELFLSNKKK